MSDIGLSGTSVVGASALLVEGISPEELPLEGREKPLLLSPTRLFYLVRLEGQGW